MADVQLLGILLIASVAGIILFRLYTVLGRRTGNEREPSDRLRRIGGAMPPARADNVVALPERSAAPAEQQSNPDDAVARGLTDIGLADRQFESGHFLEGARRAYEMIVTAFAARDRATLKPLLSDEVFAAFDAVMRGHEERGESVAYSFSGFKNVRVTHAEMKGSTAEITVEFSGQFVSTTTNGKGAVIEGDPKTVRGVTDIWTFARDSKASDPNWMLVATSSAG
ncbi:MAG TPA: Tim44/TimA family putative adaptor protein [Rhizomicrobium sp.]|jgi:predicted lipid-binding transport protein (Tim44 family)